MRNLSAMLPHIRLRDMWQLLAVERGMQETVAIVDDAGIPSFFHREHVEQAVLLAIRQLILLYQGTKDESTTGACMCSFLLSLVSDEHPFFLLSRM
jgi:hypothetical protein